MGDLGMRRVTPGLEKQFSAVPYPLHLESGNPKDRVHVENE